MNKQTWSTSYAFFMAGSCGLVLSIVYVAVDNVEAGERARAAQRALRPLQYLGQNAILVFFWHGTAAGLLNAVYLSPPQVTPLYVSPSRTPLYVNPSM